MVSRKRKKLASLKTLRHKLDRVFSEYIRRRDEQLGCITCGRMLPWKQMHAGHFVKRQFTGTRYDERNAHGQCPQCNRWRGGELVAYYKQMLLLYDQATIDQLLAKKRETVRMRREDYEELIGYYRHDLNELGTKKNPEAG